MDAEHRVTRDSQHDWHRNIVSLRRSIELYADLVDDPHDIDVLIQHEMATKHARGEPAIITRPFEDVDTYDSIAAAIEWPFEHPCRSRYSAGHFGVWYGASSIETSVRETAYHFRRNTLASQIAAQSRQPIVQERRVHLVRCNALLVDLRTRSKKNCDCLTPMTTPLASCWGQNSRARACLAYSPSPRGTRRQKSLRCLRRAFSPIRAMSAI